MRSEKRTWGATPSISAGAFSWAITVAVSANTAPPEAWSPWLWLYHVRDRLAEPAGDLGFQPFGGLGVDRVSDDDAIGRHHDDREVEIVLESPDVTRDVGQFTLGVLGQGGQGDGSGQGRGGEGLDEHLEFSPVFVTA